MDREKRYVGGEGLGLVPDPGQLGAAGLVGKDGPVKVIYVHFESREDVEDFSRLIGRKITRWTRSVWYQGTKEKGERR